MQMTSGYDRTSTTRGKVVGEAVQTVMRRYGIPEPYEKLKALTRGTAVTRELLHDFIQTLDIPPSREKAPAGADAKQLPG